MNDTPIDTAHAPADGARDLSVSLGWANVAMVAFAVPAVLLLGAPYFLWHDWRGVYYLTANTQGMLWLLAAVAAGIFLHEAIHAWTWMRVARTGRGAIRFGVNWKLITPYAHCTRPMRARAYRIGAAAPLVALGVLPTVFAWASGGPSMLLFGLFFTFAAGGDMLILWMLRGVPADAMVADHPHRAGCCVYDLPQRDILEDTAGELR